MALATGSGQFDAPVIKPNAFNPANGWTDRDSFPRLLGDVKADIVTFATGASIAYAC